MVISHLKDNLIVLESRLKWAHKGFQSKSLEDVYILGYFVW